MFGQNSQDLDSLLTGLAGPYGTMLELIKPSNLVNPSVNSLSNALEPWYGISGFSPTPTLLMYDNLAKDLQSAATNLIDIYGEIDNRKIDPYGSLLQVPIATGSLRHQILRSNPRLDVLGTLPGKIRSLASIINPYGFHTDWLVHRILYDLHKIGIIDSPYIGTP